VANAIHRSLNRSSVDEFTQSLFRIANRFFSDHVHLTKRRENRQLSKPLEYDQMWEQGAVPGPASKKFRQTDATSGSENDFGLWGEMMNDESSNSFGQVQATS
jgi:hypothetical protein